MSATTVPPKRPSRIPLSLQRIFLASQRGDDVSTIAAPAPKTVPNSSGSVSTASLSSSVNSKWASSRVRGRGYYSFGRTSMTLPNKSVTTKAKKTSTTPTVAAAPAAATATKKTKKSNSGSSSLNKLTAIFRRTVGMGRENTAAKASRFAMAQRNNQDASTKSPQATATIAVLPTIAQIPPKSTTITTSTPAVTNIPSSPVKKTTGPDQGYLQRYFDSALEIRGYKNKQYSSLDCAYYSKPTDLQIASYGLRVTNAARESNERLVGRLMGCGLSSNPCNPYGESLLHMMCRKGDFKILKALITQHNAKIQVADDYGRTPMHDACWNVTPCFQTILLLLYMDKQLMHLTDARGFTPLTYVRKENYNDWILFLEHHLDMFWPKLKDGETPPPPSSLCLEAPNTLPIPDPKNALPVQVAEMVANGNLEPEEALVFVDAQGDDTEIDDDDDDTLLSDYDDDDVSSDDDDDFSDVDSEYSSDDDSYFSDDSSVDTQEMAEFCLRAGGTMNIAQKVLYK